jgi:hypothetical protein
MSEANQSDSAGLLGQFLDAAKEAGVTRLIPTHPDDIRAALDAKDAEIARLRAALQRIARWHGEFPATGKFWDEEKTRPTSYATEYGSCGERDYMRRVAMDALGPNPSISG